ncbi:hypothetical protein EAH87_00010 [Sphingomonas koreensis]|nr:hypothetical protein EAH87_00010 [Sphingomonas koreensis]
MNGSFRQKQPFALREAVWQQFAHLGRSAVLISKRMVIDAIHAGPKLTPDAKIYHDPLTRGFANVRR